MRLWAYVYPGWHPTPERDAAFHPGFTEWELLRECAPRFEGHAQPRRPLWGEYDDRDGAAMARRTELARAHGVDGFVWASYWCRGKRVFEEPLDHWLATEAGSRTPFALMWANRMPRRILPVRRDDLPVIDPARRVDSDVEDLVRLFEHWAERYFAHPHYLRLEGALYVSIFDSSFFLRELGRELATRAVGAVRARLRELGLPPLHLAAIDPGPEEIGHVRAVGFDSVAHYVALPEWKGAFQQDYASCARARADEWADWAERAGLPYTPSIATGWDASPRGADFGPERPRKYPWWPVVTGESPAAFERALRRGLEWSERSPLRDAPCFLASLNEWTEGHYLEPDERFGYGMLQAVARARGRPLPELPDEAHARPTRP